MQQYPCAAMNYPTSPEVIKADCEEICRWWRFLQGLERPMNALADRNARVRALTDLDATLLVEAAAGTVKTALMAGRLTIMLTRGIEPASARGSEPPSEPCPKKPL